MSTTKKSEIMRSILEMLRLQKKLAIDGCLKQSWKHGSRERCLIWRYVSVELSSEKCWWRLSREWQCLRTEDNKDRAWFQVSVTFNINKTNQRYNHTLIYFPFAQYKTVHLKNKKWPIYKCKSTMTEMLVARCHYILNV